MSDWLNVNAWCEATDTDAEPWERKALVRLAHARAMVHSEKKPQAGGDQTQT